MDLNLDSLKDEMLRFLEQSGFAIFRGSAGALDDLPGIPWDSESFPDYRMFLEAATRCGEKQVIFTSAQFTEEDVDEFDSDLALSGMDSDSVRRIEREVTGLRQHFGKTCFIQMAYDHRGRLYIYELQPDWYGEYLDLVDEVEIMFPHTHEDDEDEDESLGGFYSNN